METKRPRPPNERRLLDGRRRPRVAFFPLISMAARGHEPVSVEDASGAQGLGGGDGSAPRSLLIVTHVFPPDSASLGQHMADVAATMRQRGWAVTVLTANSIAWTAHSRAVTARLTSP